MSSFLVAFTIVQLFTLSFSLTFWSDFEPRSTDPYIEEKLKKSAEAMGLSVVLKHPALICRRYRKGAPVYIDALVKAFDVMNEKTNIAEDLFERLSKEKRQAAEKAYVDYIRNSHDFTMYQDSFQKPNGSFQVEQKNTQKKFRWVDRLYDATYDELAKYDRLAKSGAIVRESFDYKKIGSYYAGLLFNKNFVCLSVPEITLHIFQMFYFRSFPQSELKNFFEGFYDGIKASIDSNSEVYLEDVTRDFFGFNMLALTGIQAKYINGLIDKFNDKESDRAAMFEGLAELYDMVLTIVSKAEEDNTEKRDNFYNELLSLKKRALLYAAKQTAAFALSFVIGLSHSQIMKGLSKVEDVVKKEFEKGNLKGLQTSFDKIVGADYYDVDTKGMSFEGIESNFDLKHLSNFHRSMIEIMNLHRSCPQCQLHSRQKKIFYQKNKLMV